MRRVFEVFYTLVATPAILLVAFLVGTFGVLPFAPMPRGRRERYTIRPAMLFSQAVTRILLATVDVTGRVQLKDERGALVISNHRSWFDPLLLIAHTGSNGLSKSIIFWIPFVGFYGWLAGAVFFDRSSREARAAARDEVLMLVRSGARVHIFPEGTRTRDGTLAERVFLTLIRDCYDAGLPVVPCAVMHTERVFPIDMPVLSPGRSCRVDVGCAMYPEDHESAEAFAIAAWDDVKAKVRALEQESD